LPPAPAGEPTSGARFHGLSVRHRRIQVYTWVYKCTPIILGEKLYYHIIHVYLTLYFYKFELNFTIPLVLYIHYLQSNSANAVRCFPQLAAPWGWKVGREI
jgi:hypothetical protein